MPAEAEIADAVENVLALVDLDRLESVRMSSDNDVSTVIDKRMASALLALGLLVLCFDAPVAGDDYDLAALFSQLIYELVCLGKTA